MDRDDDLRSLYRDMLRIRLVEEGIADRYAEGNMRCPVHLSVGQEAAAVGVCRALRPTDRAFSTHRSHAHYLAKGGDLRRMLAEIYGKATGCLGGRGGSMHLMDPLVGMECSIPIVSSNIPLAVGWALADHQRGTDGVSVAFMGDAATEEGVFHESLNLAQVHHLPVLFVCENNLYSVYTPLRTRQPERTIAAIPRAHGVWSREVDGNDVVAVLEAATEAVARCRRGEGPAFLELATYRWREHCGPDYDNDAGYRTAEEFEAWRARDPLAQHRARVGVTDGEHAALQAELLAEVDDAFRFADESPLPTSDLAAAGVYAS